MTRPPADFEVSSVYDALVISDIHLGSQNCQAKHLVHFLQAVHRGELPTQRLILNGDVFDSIDFRRLNKQHWKILSMIRKLSDHVQTIWINGNHDGPAEIISHLLGVEVRDEIILKSGKRRVMLLHGHRFDEFIERFPVMTRFADGLYRFLQWLDRTHFIARQAKSRSKTFLRCVDKVKAKSIEYAELHDCDAVCCGHTHQPRADEDGPIGYYNSGCWTEYPCHYLAIKDGVIALRSFAPEQADDVPSEVQEPASEVAIPTLAPQPAIA